MLAEIPKEQLKGMVSVKGSSNSHAAIMARALGIPAVMGLDDIPLLQLEGEQIIVDGYSGHLLIDPPVDVSVEYQELIDEEKALEQEVLLDKDLPAQTLDGVRVSLMLNAGLGAGYESAQAIENDGIGLFRTEYLFMVKQAFPSEHEQYELYRQILERQQHKPVVMRILDVGGDKSLPYFPIVEDNPFLGWRGIRLTLDHPEIFLVQIRAMIRANIGLGNLHIMLPMISAVDEVDESMRLIKQAFFEIRDECPDLEVIKPKVGIMIEVPSIIYLIDDLADKIDFCSVGSNDLTQYLLAVDRNNARVFGLYDYFHPAVLRALNDIITKTSKHNMAASICGELAGDPAGAILLFAMGYRQLSMNANNLAKIKWVLRQLSLTDCQQLLAKCIKATHASKVHHIINEFMELKGLGGLIRAGR
jgi:phosphotransferase system enzyme I (PtsP)